MESNGVLFVVKPLISTETLSETTLLILVMCLEPSL